ncbi:MAG TPA: hypothetical protein VG099_01035, partial [Gemmataceae bacterium]|nr:hypothetical protein [Gemmataceae bacterium]
MIDENRVNDLLEKWDEFYGQGQELPALDLCRNCPDLLEPVQEAIRKLKNAYRLRDASPLTEETPPGSGTLLTTPPPD